MIINGNKLPERVVNLINENRWIEPTNKSNLLRLVVEKSPFNYDLFLLESMVRRFTLYNLELMERESLGFKKWALSGERTMFYGKEDCKVRPGKINPNKLILFADFGIGEDTPFGLDFQNDESSPKVVLLYYHNEAFEKNRWVEIADSFEDFEKMVMN
jgi:hypothetical protein